MNIHCLCLVRDEADIVRYTLEAALEWAYAIYVLDNGSSDGTWELLQEYAGRYPQLVLVGRDCGPYRTSLWADIAKAAKKTASKGDWWCRLDADELYVDDPREFLAKIGERDQVVFSVSVHYYFTDVDLAAYHLDPSAYTERWHPERLRYYKANWGEPRFARHIPGASWTDEWPRGFWNLPCAPSRIRLRHYQYRSPPQIEQRVRTRITRTQAGRFTHEKTSAWVPIGLRQEDLAFPESAANGGNLWESRVVKATALHQDDGSTDFHIDWELLPSMWKPQPFLTRALERARRVWQRSPLAGLT